MKRMIFLIFLLCPTLNFAQTIQQGRVLEKDSNGRPLANTELQFENAAIANSDTDGKFKLLFPDKKPGELIFSIAVRKKGYELVNVKQVDEWVLSEKKELNIILCREGQLRLAREHFYSVGRSHYNREYERKREELDILNQSRNITEEAYKRKSKELWDEHQKALELLEEYADMFSRVNKDELNQKELCAFELTEQGKIDEAIKVYENERLLERFIANDSLAKRTSKDIASLLPSLKRYAELCAFAGGKENYDKAEKSYQAIVISDTTNISNLLDFSNFLVKQNKFLNALKWLQTAGNSAKLNEDVFIILQNIAQIFNEIHEYDKAEKSFRQAQEVLMKFDTTETSIRYWEGSVGLYSNWALLNQSQNQYAEAQKFYDEVILALKQILTKTPPENWKTYTAVSARILNNQGMLFEEKNDYNKAEENLQMALAGYRLLAEENPEEFRIYLARILNNLGMVQAKMNKLEESEANFEESLILLRELVLINPEAHLNDFSATLNNYGMLKVQMSRNAEALTLLQQSNDIMDRLTVQNPEAFSVMYARYLSNIAFVQINLQLYPEAKHSFEESLDIFSENPEKDKNTYMETLFGYALLQKNMQQLKGAEDNFKKALIIARELEKTDNDKYNYFIANTTLHMADVNFFQENSSDAIKNYKEAIYLFRNLHNDKAEFIDPSLSWSLNNLAWLTYKTDLKKAIIYGQEAIDLLEKYPTDSGLIQGLAYCRLRMARYLILDSQPEKAEKFARAATVIDSTFLSKKNLAHALLFQGKYEEAFDLYSEIATDIQIRTICLSDFDEFENSGIRHPDVDKVRRLLQY